MTNSTTHTPELPGSASSSVLSYGTVFPPIAASLSAPSLGFYRLTHGQLRLRSTSALTAASGTIVAYRVFGCQGNHGMTQVPVQGLRDYGQFTQYAAHETAVVDWVPCYDGDIAWNSSSSTSRDMPTTVAGIQIIGGVGSYVLEWEVGGECVTGQQSDQMPHLLPPRGDAEMYFDQKYDAGRFVALNLAKQAIQGVTQSVNPLLGAITNAGLSYFLGDNARASGKGRSQQLGFAALRAQPGTKNLANQETVSVGIPGGETAYTAILWHAIHPQQSGTTHHAYAVQSGTGVISVDLIVIARPGTMPSTDPSAAQ